MITPTRELAQQIHAVLEKLAQVSVLYFLLYMCFYFLGDSCSMRFHYFLITTFLLDHFIKNM